MPEEVELVWDDSVAPEAAIDLDAPSVSNGDVLKAFATAFGFFGAVYMFVKFSDPESRNPVAPRAAVIDHGAFRADLGLPETVSRD